MKFGKRINHLLQSTDIFGIPIIFTINKHDSAKTLIGGILTILLLSLMAVLFWFQVQDSFQKTNPTISTFIDIKKNSDEILIDINSMPIAFALNNLNGTFFNNKMSLIATQFDQNDTNFPQKLNLVECKKEQFSFITEEEYNDLNLKNFLCISNQNIKVQGYRNEKYQKYFNLKISYCDIESSGNGITSNSGCDINYVRNEVRELMKKDKIYFTVYYQSNAFNSKNYSDPIIQYVDMHLIQLDTHAHKVSEIFLQKHKLITDDGFLLENIINHEIVSFDGYINDSQYKEDNTMIELNVFSSNREYTYRRVYKKIQSCMADIMALFEYLRFAVALLFSIFGITKKNVKLMNKLYEFDFNEISKTRSRKNGGVDLIGRMRQSFYMNNSGLDPKNPFNFKRPSALNYKIIKIVSRDEINNRDINGEEKINLKLLNEEGNNQDISQGPTERQDLKINSGENLLLEQKVEDKSNFINNFNQVKKNLKENSQIPNDMTNMGSTLNVKDLSQNKKTLKNSKSDSVQNKPQLLNSINRSGAKPRKITTVNFEKLGNIQNVKKIPTSDSENAIDKKSQVDVTSKVKAIQIDLTDYYKIRKNLFKKHELHFTNFEIIKIYLFKCCIKEKGLKIKNELYRRAEQKLEELLDIRNVMNKLEEVEKLKFVLFNDGQLSMFNLSAREMCSLDMETLRLHEYNYLKDFQNDKIRINKAMDLYSQTFTNIEDVDEIDERLIKLLPSEVRSVLEKKYENN